ncbi:MAG: hypothetical protein AAGC49_12395 [Brevundimonas sp.]
MASSVVQRRVQSGRWQRLHQGVMLLHSGAPTWRERAHGAVLYAGRDAALSHASAAFVHGMAARPGAVIEVSIPATRAVRPSRGLRIHRRQKMPRASGRLRAVNEDATAVDLVDAARSLDEAVSAVVASVRRGLLPDRILAEAAERARLRHRAALVEMLSPGADEIESPLEFRYGRDVERRHGLPRGRTQLRQQVGGRWIRADRVYVGFATRVEVDGQLAHPHGRTDDDVWRDNALVLAHREVTLRYRWHHVAATPCASAAQVAHALRLGGWQGTPRRCGPSCTLDRVGGRAP